MIVVYVAEKLSGEWSEVEALFDRLLDLPLSERTTMLRGIARVSARMSEELAELLAAAGQDGTPLDQPAYGTTPVAAPLGMAAGLQVGAYRIVSVLGQGGMGEVYLAERADGQFDQQVALKIIRADAVENLARFQFERQTLARLDHPNITRIYDGGVLADGRPYMVMELVAGVPITAWCRDHASSLAQRLDLFLAVCRAVAHAHRNLVVHRDLKPGNVLVTGDGTVKVLDFGIAKQITDGAYLETQVAPVTPAYAAPEQLTGAPISTATDTYALGMLLYELLVDQRPLHVDGMPLLAIIDRIVSQPLPALSKFAAGLSSPPIAPKALAGDLDAIVAKALRKEPERRYQTVEALVDDLQRHLDGQPVAARGGARGYVLGRFIRRHRLPIAAATVTLGAILAGLGGISLQYVRAESEAKRAMAIKTFLQDMFSDADPNFPANKPRDQVTATELVDLGFHRIDRIAGDDVALKTELIKAVSSIYFNLSEYDKGKVASEKGVEEARKYYGPLSKEYLDAMIELASWLNTGNDAESFKKALKDLDGEISQAGLDRSEIRAKWWDLKGQELRDVSNNFEASVSAFDKAIALFADVAPRSEGYYSALNNAAGMHLLQGDYQGALALNQRSLAILKDPKTSVVIPRAIVQSYTMIANEQRMLGRISEADSSYQQAAKAALEFTGVGNLDYWIAVGNRAVMAHSMGDRDKAMTLFATYIPYLPDDLNANLMAATQKMNYAFCLADEGRAPLAVPILEAVVAAIRANHMENTLAYRAELYLGDAYDRVGRTEDARALLEHSSTIFQTKMSSTMDAVRSGERWARFLLDRGKPPPPRPSSTGSSPRRTIGGRPRTRRRWHGADGRASRWRRAIFPRRPRPAMPRWRRMTRLSPITTSATTPICC
ncbi:serine/threonine-protein kinase [Nitrospirillum sp. BR 11164]|uniref:serine/threonine-protein kinase n=1 Tax=Nitrospirillum sp. BR 11164 TaxID=3104324 RepID=UPI002AFFAD11|nr:serine/threonine-protein kinase [Nitrospirillum sp. BR 11164]MEA1648561.1 serine/threonine-protein kinase [Nitrospirillum sp. BR 11164]